MQQCHLLSTDLLDFEAPAIQSLVRQRNWAKLEEYERIGAVYDFVKDEIKFGYNHSDDIPASQVLEDGYGQCNTKGTLLMALLRALGIKCRIHGFTIDQRLQKGAIPRILLFVAPTQILHSWVEVLYQGKWLNLEGFILDKTYMQAVQFKFSKPQGAFYGYGIATSCIESPGVDWNGQDTYIQKEGILNDFGVFQTPDDFYVKYGTNLSGVRRWLYQSVFRHIINWNVNRIRAGYSYS